MDNKKTKNCFSGGSVVYRLPNYYDLKNAPPNIETETAYKSGGNYRAYLYAVLFCLLLFRQLFVSVAVCIVEYRA